MTASVIGVVRRALRALFFYGAAAPRLATAIPAASTIRLARTPRQARGTRSLMV